MSEVEAEFIAEDTQKIPEIKVEEPFEFKTLPVTQDLKDKARAENKVVIDEFHKASDAVTEAVTRPAIDYSKTLTQNKL